MKSTEDHLREMLSERAGRVQPAPVPQRLEAALSRAPHRVRLPAVLAAAAVVAVVAVAAVVPTLGGGGGQRTPAPPTSSHSTSSSPRPAKSLVPATSRFPAAGVCGSTSSPVVTIRIEPDTPSPRCAKVRPDQQLRVVNRTGDFGQGAHTVRLTWIPGHPVTLGPGQSQTFTRPFGEYLARGVHRLRVSPSYSAEIWLT